MLKANFFRIITMKALNGELAEIEKKKGFSNQFWLKEIDPNVNALTNNEVDGLPSLGSCKLLLI